MLVSVENEPIVSRYNGEDRWEYVRDTKTGWRGYLHMGCDAIHDDKGFCLMCGSPCPTIWTEV